MHLPPNTAQEADVAIRMLRAGATRTMVARRLEAAGLPGHVIPDVIDYARAAIRKQKRAKGALSGFAGVGAIALGGLMHGLDLPGLMLGQVPAIAMFVMVSGLVMLVYGAHEVFQPEG